MAVTSIDGSDEDKLSEIVAQGSLDFDGWTALIATVEHMHSDNIDKLSLIYDSFLSKFPLCYGYWKKYAEHMARLCHVDDVVQIYERAVEAVPYSVGVWVDYCSFSVSSFEDPFDVCRLFERGLSFTGKDYLCHKLWDKYIEFEYSQQHWNSLANIYIQTLKFPTKKLHQYYESFKKLVTIWEGEMGFQGSSRAELQPNHERRDELLALEDSEISRIVSDLLELSTRSMALLKYLAIGEEFYKRACDLDAKIKKFEQNIRRPYFHVKPLDDNQLQNWHRYLDVIEMEGDFDWAVKLYERCLISCAHYPEFWMRYVDYVESKGGKEIATDALDRATNIFLKNASEIHLFNAWFKEKRGDFDGVNAAFVQCEQHYGSHFVDIVQRRANMEKRKGNYAVASNVYKEALNLAAEKIPDMLPLLYVHYARLQYMITNSVQATREILLDGIRQVPHSKILLKEVMLFGLLHDEARQVDLLDSVISQALTLGSDVSGGLSTKDREDISRLYIEFIDSCGSIHEIRMAWNRHLRLFPHLVRVQSSPKKSAKAGMVLEKVTECRPGSSNAHSQMSIWEPQGNHLIQMSQSEEKVLVLKNIDKRQLVHFQTQLEDGNRNVNDLELVSEATESLLNDKGKANEAGIEIVCQAAEDRDPKEVKDSQTNGIKEDQEREQTHNVTALLSPGLEAPLGASLSNGRVQSSRHDVDEIPSMSSPVSPQDINNAAETCNDSHCPSSTLTTKGHLISPSPDRPLDREENQHRHKSGRGRPNFGSPENVDERLERSLSPRRRNSHGYFDDRRRRDRSLSPRRHNSRWNSEDRWPRDRRNRRYSRHPDNSRGQRDSRQNQNIMVIGNRVQPQNAQQLPIGSASQTQLPVQPIAYPQVQMTQYPQSCNEQVGNVQNSQIYNQMWQYYYQQQQLLLQQQSLSQEQQLQPMPPLQQMHQQMQNPVQQLHMQTPQQSQSQQTIPHQQQLLHSQYQQQQLYHQHQQKQTNEQPQSVQQQQQMQMQLPQLYQNMQLPQQEQHQQVPIQQQQLPLVKQPEQPLTQQQQQPPLLPHQQPQLQQQKTQVKQQEEAQLHEQQQQSYQYQQLQQQQYFLYLQQLHQYQHSQQQAGLVQDTETQQNQEKLSEIQPGNVKLQSQQDESSSQVDSISNSHPQGRVVEYIRDSTSSGVASQPQALNQVPEIEGTDV